MPGSSSDASTAIVAPSSIAIAASLAAGTVANFGTMTKSLHAGRTAQSGVLAARLANPVEEAPRIVLSPKAVDEAGFTDVLVLGSGAAGLQAALHACQASDVLVVTKDHLDQSATAYAQGGIAAATDPADSPAKHAADTLAVACGLGHEDVIRQVVGEAPEIVARLQQAGARFDQRGTALETGREGGHSLPRIVHARDTTGREILRALVEQTRAQPRIRIFEQCFAIDLLTHDGQVVGAVTYHPKYGHQIFWATTTILATGGCGRVYRETASFINSIPIRRSPPATGSGWRFAPGQRCATWR